VLLVSYVYCKNEELILLFRVLGTGKRSHKVTHHFVCYFLRSRAVRSLPCAVKAHVGMEPHAKTPPPLLLSSEVTAA